MHRRYISKEVYHVFYCYMKRNGPKIILPFIIGLVLLFTLSSCGSVKNADYTGDSRISPAPADEPRLPGNETTENDDKHAEENLAETVAEPVEEATGLDEAGTAPADTTTDPDEAGSEQPDAAADPDETGTALADTTAEPGENTSNGDADVQEVYYEEAPDFAYFQPVDLLFKDHNFDIRYDEEMKASTIYGTYDLDGDGQVDEINAALITCFYGDSYVKVNNTMSEYVSVNFTGEVYLIDLDTRDSYIEIAIEDAGPSADYTLDLFRYDGTKVRYLGLISRSAYLDGQGRYISWFCTSKGISPTFFCEWEELTNGEWILKRNRDMGQYIGKTYNLHGQAYFVPIDKMPEDYHEFLDYVDWDPDAIKEFDWTEIKILNIYMDSSLGILNWFYIEMPDEEKGLLYFWIGD
jgi:hypothetical protein